MTILITGGNGFIGRQLQLRLADGTDRVLTTTRGNSDSATSQSSVNNSVRWNPLDGPLTIPQHQLADQTLKAVVNLMGEPVAGGRWNEAKKNRIRESRVKGTRNLVDGLVRQNQVPSVFISASAVGYYGDCGEDWITESTKPATNFLAEVSQAWESEAKRLAEFGSRVVILRIGIVMGKGGGALKEMLPIFRLGGGGRLGSGEQWVPWIHVDDLVRMIIWGISREHVCGVLNATAPNPVRNIELTQQLARALGRPAILPVPKFALRLAFGEFADSLLASQRIRPDAALHAGFQFKFIEFKDAISNLLA